MPESSRRKQKKATLYLLSALTMALFIAFICVTRWTILFVSPLYHWFAFLLSVPCIASAVILVSVIKGTMQKTSSVVAAVSLVLVIALLAGVWFGFASLGMMRDGTSESGQYESIRNSSGFDAQMLWVFPASIPETASNISFFYQPALGQGGKVLQLQFSETSEYISTYTTKLEQRSIWSSSFNDTEREEYGVLGLSAQFSVAASHEPPADTMLYILFSQPYRQGDWNHGQVSYVATSVDESLILFYAEKW